jgi:sugar lactone lactonase YvrE
MMNAQRSRRISHGLVFGELKWVLLVLLVVAALMPACTAAPPGQTSASVFFPRPPSTPRLQYLTHFSTSEDVSQERGAFAQLVFGDRKEKDEIVKPYGLAVHKGVIYACDTKRNIIIVFNVADNKFGYLGFQGRGKLAKPINLCIDSRGYKYVADAERSEIVVFDNDDSFYNLIGTDDLERPVDVAIDGNTLYVCDVATSEIVVFDRAERRYRTRFGGQGTEAGKFARPTNMAIGGDGRVYISDTINGRVQKCGADGTHEFTYGSLGDRLGQFARPKGIALDRDGRLYVVDAAFENVQIFNDDGELLLFFSESGNEPGQLNLPAQVIVDYDNVKYFKQYADRDFEIEYLVFVTSQYGPRKINVFGFGRYVEAR